jgi:hypothetical protein
VSKKKYNLAAPILLSDANRLLGIPKRKPLTLREFQDYATSRTVSIKHKFVLEE